jgi:hypothetical protein
MTKPKKSLYSRIFLDKDSKLVLVQFPNAALAVAIIAWVGLVFINAAPYNNILTFIYRIALVGWGVLEIGWGDTIFRRILGLLVILSIGFGMIFR